MKPGKIFRRPDFLVIGAQKAGTSWLHSVFSAHPEFWMPPAKELHYFDHKFPPKASDDKHPPGMEEQRRRMRAKRVRRLDAAKIWSLLVPPSATRIVWEFEYAFGKRTDEWYCNLFKPAGNRLTGDITPAYSRLDDGAVEYIHALLPDVRIIFLVRNPVERAWSHAVMDLVKHQGRRFEEVTDSQFIAHFESRASRLRTGYIEIIDRWQRVCGKESLFVGFFDQIVEEPADLINEICRFLGATGGAEILPAGICQQRVNPGRGRQPTKECAAHLAGMYRTEIEELSRRFGRYSQLWLESLGKQEL